VIQLPPADTQAPCPHFPACGGCTIQDRLPATQANYKEAWLQDLLAPILTTGELQPLLRSTPEESYFFRGKIRYGFLATEQGIVASRHGEGVESAEVPIQTCLLQSPLSVELARFTAEFATHQGWQVFNPKTHQGTLKHLLVREGKRTGECLISLVTTETKLSHLIEWALQIQSNFPTVTSIYQTKTQGRNNERSEDVHLAGERVIHETIGHYTFTISPHAFFQTNTLLVERLYTVIKEMADLNPEDILWDLYAGSASIGIFLSQSVKNVLSIESNLQNIADAAENLRHNAVSNVEIAAGSLEKVITSAFIKQHAPPSVIVVDPPRAGLSETLRVILPNLRANRIIYTSCNPLTFRRDAEILLKSGYRLESVQGLDMFPHTLHCELVARFRILSI